MNDTDSLTRRDLLVRSVQAAAVAGLASSWGSLQGAPVSPEEDRPVIWDCHVHLSVVTGTPDERARQLLKYADRMGIERLVLFLGATSRLENPPPKQLVRDNDEVMRAISVDPNRLFGFVYLNPNYVEESLKELDRCVHNGPMVGIKLWIALRCNHPNLDPICRRAIELKAPVLQHTYWRTGPTSYPGESLPPDVTELALRHPQVSIIAAHSGNNWECGIRALRPAKNVVAEASGFDPTSGMVDMAVRELGAERVIYGSDAGGRSFASQMSKVLGADVPPSAKRLILSENLKRLLRPILIAKGIRL